MVHPKGVEATLSISSTTHLRRRPGWPQRLTVKALGDVVHDWLREVDGELDNLRDAVREEAAQRQVDVESAREESMQSIRELQERLREAELRAAEHQSRALPVVALGAVMGTVPEAIAALPLWIYVIVMVLIIWFSAAAFISARTYRHNGSASS